MANLTVANGLLHARALYVDTDTTDPAVSDATLTKIANEKYLLWHARVEPRWVTASLATLVESTASYTTTAVNIAEINTVYDASLALGVLEQIEIHRYRQKMFDSSSNGTPIQYALERAQTDTEANIGKWIVYPYPPPDALAATKVLTGIVRLVPALVSEIPGTDQMDVSDEAAYTIWRMVAAEAARMVGEDAEFIAGILAPIKDDVLTAMGMTALALRPRITEGERAA